MLAFSRLTSILLFVLSLSFLTCAAPTPKSNALAAREGVRSDAGLLVAACVDARAKVVASADVICKLDDIVKIKTNVKVMIDDINVFATLVAKLKLVDADVKVKAEIAAHLLVILKAIIKICVHLIAKLSLNVALELIASIQAALKLVIDNLNVCIVGFLEVFVKIVTDAELKALADVHLDAILKVIVTLCVKLGLNVDVKVLGPLGISL
ncbi:unnamed protein product [Rhizoctonia solani]|uniref:Transmembrane protein n=1 Tax=Rhizoctonia solani TaxID=456999 RepID=A0A8H3BSL4_9AGAM|nr:unnamed protein product [Rhizoctonia solani]